MRPTVALTGATGFLGRALAASFKGEGWHVRALVRPGRDTTDDFESVPGSLEDEAALDLLVTGADAVVHAAGLTKAVRPSAFFAVNADGTERLLASLERRAPSAHFTLVSSLAAREPAISPYAASKHRAEEIATARVSANRLAIVRPPALYGPYDRQTLSMFRAARLPFSPCVGSGRERIALCHVSDAADAIVGLVRERAGGLATLADNRPEGYSMREIVVAAARAQGRTARPVSVPAALLGGIGRVAEMAASITRRPALLSPDKLREMLHEDWSVDPATMPPGLAARARGIAEGFSQAVAWYRKAGWL